MRTNRTVAQVTFNEDHLRDLGLPEEHIQEFRMNHGQDFRALLEEEGKETLKGLVTCYLREKKAGTYEGRGTLYF